MSVDNDDLDIGLAQGYSTQDNQTRLSNDSGAGVNASSKVDITFVASDPLSELVWSPQKGASLKCADCSFIDKKPSILQDVGPSNTVISPLQSMRSRGSNDGKFIAEENIITSQMVLPADSKVGDRATGSAPLEFGSSHEHQSGKEDQRQNNFLSLGVNASRSRAATTKPLSGEFNDEMVTGYNAKIEDVAICSEALGLDVAMDSGICTVKQSEAFDSPVPTLPVMERRQESIFLTEKQSKNKMMMRESKTKNPLEKLECTAENDLQHLIAREAYGQSEERPQREKSDPIKSTPTNSRTLLYRKKGKEKALSDGDVDKQNTKDEHDSHESVESCNSAGLPWKGKKRWSFEQQLIVGRKRIRKQTEESPTSTPFTRQDSSFMHWISNMVKGLAKSSQYEASPLSLTYAHSNDGQKSHDQKLVTCNKTSASGSRNMGFQRFFHSLYCSNIMEARMSGDDYPRGGSKEPELVAKTCSADINPFGCVVDNDKSCPQLLGNGEGPSTQPWTIVANIAGTQGICMINSAEEKTSSNFACSKEKDGVSSSGFPLGKHETNSGENKKSDPLSEGRANYSTGCGSDPHGSLWITRFTPKFPCPVLNVGHCNKVKDGELEDSDDCVRVISYTPNNVDYPIDRKKAEARDCSTEEANVVVKELKNDAPSTDASFGFEEVGGHDDKKSSYKLNPILPSQKLRSSEAIACMFARRLDALKNIILPDVKDDPTVIKVTCLFCGRSGHDLCDCLKITETELEELLKNITSYDGTKETPCLCIRCFRLNHWAVACPVASSSRQQQSADDALLVNQHGASKLQHCTGSKRDHSMLETKECHRHFVFKDKKLRAGTNHSLDQIKCRNMVSERRGSTLDEAQKHIALSYRVNELKGSQITPCKFVDRKILDVPKALFDAIRRLRLSRINILRLLNSETSLLHLNGFFLRLRLANWKEGLGGTGYYAACITGIHTGGAPKQFQTPISVSMGGVKCLVKSQYVSNNDFLEEELMAWCCTTLKSGGKIPSADELLSKLEIREKLGF